jgi:hypothetical protein
LWIDAAEKVARHRHAQSVRGALAGDINAKTHTQIAVADLEPAAPIVRRAPEPTSP